MKFSYVKFVLLDCFTGKKDIKEERLCERQLILIYLSENKNKLRNNVAPD